MEALLGDKSILERMKAGDNAVFRLVFDQHYPVLFRFAFSLLRDKTLAEEAADDAILYLWQNCDRITISHSLRSYLMQTVRHGCIDRMRSLRRTKNYEALDITPEDNLRFLEQVYVGAEQPLGSLLDNELEALLVQSINKLPPECGEVFRRSRMLNESYVEIAAALGISVNTVKYHIKNALNFLRKDLADYLRFVALLLATQS